MDSGRRLNMDYNAENYGKNSRHYYDNEDLKWNILRFNEMYKNKTKIIFDDKFRWFIENEKENQKDLEKFVYEYSIKMSNNEMYDFDVKLRQEFSDELESLSNLKIKEI